MSGIAAMQLARFVENGCTLHMDLRRAVIGDADADATAWLRDRLTQMGGAGDKDGGSTASQAVNQSESMTACPRDSLAQMDGAGDKDGGMTAAQAANQSKSTTTCPRDRLTQMGGAGDKDGGIAASQTANQSEGTTARAAGTPGVSPAVPLARDLLLGAATPALADALWRASGVVCGARAASELSPEELRALADALCDYTLRVTGTRGWEQAQVTAGGARTAQFDPGTLQSNLVSGLYAAGEVLDVDGDCGGYNLLFAFASGMLAGRASAV